MSSRMFSLCVPEMPTASSALSFQVMESEEFMLLPANQLIDIISSDELNVRSEEQVFNAVMAWVKYSIQERRPQLPQVRVLHKCTIVTPPPHQVQQKAFFTSELTTLGLNSVFICPLGTAACPPTTAQPQVPGGNRRVGPSH